MRITNLGKENIPYKLSNVLYHLDKLLSYNSTTTLTEIKYYFDDNGHEATIFHFGPDEIIKKIMEAIIEWNQFDIIETMDYNKTEENILKNYFIGLKPDYLNNSSEYVEFFNVLLQENNDDLVIEEDDISSNGLSNFKIVNQFYEPATIDNDTELDEIIQGTFQYVNNSSLPLIHQGDFKYWNNNTSEEFNIIIINPDNENEWHDYEPGDIEAKWIEEQLKLNIDLSEFTYNSVSNEDFNNSIKEWLKDDIATDIQFNNESEHFLGFLNYQPIDIHTQGMCQEIWDNFEYWNEWCKEELNINLDGSTGPDELIFTLIPFDEEDGEGNTEVEVNESMMYFVDKFDDLVDEMPINFAYCITGDYIEELHFKYMQVNFILEYLNNEKLYVLHRQDNTGWSNDVAKNDLDIYFDVEIIFKEKQQEYSTKLRDMKDEAGVSDIEENTKNVKVIYSNLDPDNVLVGEMEYDYIYTFNYSIDLNTGEIWFDKLPKDLIIFGSEMDRIRNYILEQTNTEMKVGKTVSQRALQIVNSDDNSFSPDKDVVAYMEYKDDNWMINFHNIMFQHDKVPVETYILNIFNYLVKTGLKQENLNQTQFLELCKWAYSGLVKSAIYGAQTKDYYEIMGDFSYLLTPEEVKTKLINNIGDPKLLQVLEEIEFFELENGLLPGQYYSENGKIILREFEDNYEILNIKTKLLAKLHADITNNFSDDIYLWIGQNTKLIKITNIKDITLNDIKTPEEVYGNKNEEGFSVGYTLFLIDKTGTSFKINEYHLVNIDNNVELQKWDDSAFDFDGHTFIETEGYTDERADFNNSDGVAWEITDELRQILLDKIEFDEDDEERKFSIDFIENVQEGTKFSVNLLDENNQILYFFTMLYRDKNDIVVESIFNNIKGGNVSINDFDPFDIDDAKNALENYIVEQNPNLLDDEIPWEKNSDLTDSLKIYYDDNELDVVDTIFYYPSMNWKVTLSIEKEKFYNILDSLNANEDADFKMIHFNDHSNLSNQIDNLIYRNNVQEVSINELLNHLLVEIPESDLENDEEILYISLPTDEGTAVKIKIEVLATVWDILNNNLGNVNSNNDINLDDIRDNNFEEFIDYLDESNLEETEIEFIYPNDKMRLITYIDTDKFKKFVNEINSDSEIFNCFEVIPNKQINLGGYTDTEDSSEYFNSVFKHLDKSSSQLNGNEFVMYMNLYTENKVYSYEVSWNADTSDLLERYFVD